MIRRRFLGPVQPGGAIDALMDRFDNLYGDLPSNGARWGSP